MTANVLILGASGKIGRYSARTFETAGWNVRRFIRGEDDLIQAAKGSDVIVNGLNPPSYHNWESIIPQITQMVITAAQASNASVIIPGNVYHFGNQPGVWSQETPPKPVSRKGEIRLKMEQDYAASGVQTIILRAGNFIDPEARDCVMSQMYLRNLKHNKITVPGPVETKQAMCFLPDWARAAVALAAKRSDLSQFEDIPFEGHTLSALDIKQEIEQILGRDLRFTKFPWWLFKIASPFWELAREMKEMQYLWNTDHALCNAKLDQLLPDFKASSLETVFRKMVTDNKDEQTLDPLMVNS